MNADLVYAAGFMDADGTFIFQTRKDRPGVVHVRPVLAAYNVCRAPLELLVSLFGGSVQPVQRRKPTLSVQLQWRVQGKRATDGAAAMLPYLRVKQRQAAGSSDADRAQMVAFAESCVGQQYGFLTIVTLLVWVLFGGKLVLGLDGTEICSGLAAQAVVRDGTIFARNPAQMMPADIAEHYRVRLFDEPLGVAPRW